MRVKTIQALGHSLPREERFAGRAILENRDLPALVALSKLRERNPGLARYNGLDQMDPSVFRRALKHLENPRPLGSCETLECGRRADYGAQRLFGCRRPLVQSL